MRVPYIKPSGPVPLIVCGLPVICAILQVGISLDEPPEGCAAPLLDPGAHPSGGTRSTKGRHKPPALTLGQTWAGWRSNSRPSHYECAALPTEHTGIVFSTVYCQVRLQLKKPPGEAAHIEPLETRLLQLERLQRLHRHVFNVNTPAALLGASAHPPPERASGIGGTCR